MKAQFGNSSVDWSSIKDALDNAHQYDGYIAAACPFHDDLRPSFFVYPDWYRCLACDAQGPTSRLLERLGKVVRIPNPRAREYTGPINPFTIWMKQRTLKTTLRIAWEMINQNPGLGNYIVVDRGIDEPYRKRLGIGYIDDWYTIPMRNRNGIIIGAVARKGRDNQSSAKYVLPNGTNPNLLYVPNWKRVRDASYLIVTYGILDAIVIAMCGYPVASTITGKTVSRVTFASYRIPILLIPDRGEEVDGLIGVQKLGWRGVLAKIPWPDHCKDINDIWTKDRNLCKEILKGATHGIGRGE